MIYFCLILKKTHSIFQTDHVGAKLKAAVTTYHAHVEGLTHNTKNKFSEDKEYVPRFVPCTNKSQKLL